MLLFRAIGRMLVATAAGAGLGAGAALYRRHLHEEPDAVPAGTWEPVATPAAAPTVVEEVPVSPSPPPRRPAPAPAPSAAVPAGVPTAADLAALQTSVADLEAARQRLRDRAAAIRAEMEETTK